MNDKTEAPKKQENKVETQQFINEGKLGNVVMQIETYMDAVQLRTLERQIVISLLTKRVQSEEATQMQENAMQQMMARTGLNEEAIKKLAEGINEAGEGEQ